MPNAQRATSQAKYRDSTAWDFQAGSPTLKLKSDRLSLGLLAASPHQANHQVIIAKNYDSDQFQEISKG